MINVDKVKNTKDLIIFLVENSGRYFFTNEDWRNFHEWFGAEGIELTNISFVELCPSGESEIKCFQEIPRNERIDDDIDAVLDLGDDGKVRVYFAFKGVLETEETQNA